MAQKVILQSMTLQYYQDDAVSYYLKARLFLVVFLSDFSLQGTLLTAKSMVVNQIFHLKLNIEQR